MAVLAQGLEIPVLVRAGWLDMVNLGSELPAETAHCVRLALLAVSDQDAFADG